MNFGTLPQDLRDTVFSYWSPSKEIKARRKKAYPIFKAFFMIQDQHNRIMNAKYFETLWRSFPADVHWCEIHVILKSYNEDGLIYERIPFY